MIGAFHGRVTTYLPSLQSISIELCNIKRQAFFIGLRRDTKAPASPTALVLLKIQRHSYHKAYLPVMACRKLVLNVEFRANFTAELDKM
jgi:hypothetical protein